MKLAAVRILVKNGNSYGIAIPRAFLMHMRLVRGSELELVYDDDTDTITVRATKPIPRNFRGVMTAREPRPVL